MNTLCQSCDAEIKTLNELAKTCDTIDFVVINCDYEFVKFQREQPRPPTYYRYLNFNKQFDTMNQLGIIDYPIAFLLNHQGAIQTFFEMLPSRGLEIKLRDLP
ncbi:hypothetical protein FACS1894201_11260 [Bacteroidia bacterium]|nr:hypothetical protein FACS1894201_11260 [Bacteroidia bacterium]